MLRHERLANAPSTSRSEPTFNDRFAAAAQLHRTFRRNHHRLSNHSSEQNGASIRDHSGQLTLSSGVRGSIHNTSHASRKSENSCMIM
ncbi:unnamed protein product [Phytomonas sp. Hart1]|nr:unnamed protein product [Phytomonas sp. Hart1]|eukprot:CCW71076.1 unnamed protein product [Phytomonas sp. isolate Hart1]